MIRTLLFPVSFRSQNKRRAFSLIEILVVLVLLAVAGAFLLPRYLGGGGAKRADNKPATVKNKAEDGICQNYLGQVRQGIYMLKTSDPDGTPVQSLSELKGYPRETLQCPVGKEAYVYDPKTGEVHCPHPGHEKY